MRRLTYMAALALVASLALAPSAGAQGQTTTVSIQDFFFSPANITVAPGTTVTWVNNGQAPHTATATNPSGAFDSGTLQPGQSYSYTFEQPGTYAYYCAIHPDMTGTVTVSSASPAAAGKLPSTGGGESLALSAALLAVVVLGALTLAVLRRGRRASSL